MKRNVGNKVIEIEQYKALPCSLQTFTINEESVSLNDFGYTQDIGVSDEPYACANRVFIANKSIGKIYETMQKYNLTNLEYDEIILLLSDMLNIGYCGWCV